MRALIFINGMIADYAPIRALLRPDDLLIAADGGARHLAALDLLPHRLVGDLDSVAEDDLARARAAGIRIEQSPVAKDQTDLELAIESALDATQNDAVDEVILVGATGGRLDQTLANLHILAQRDWRLPLRIVDGDQIATLLRGPARQVIEGTEGALVSSLALSAQVTGITYTGLRYPLHDYTLVFGSTRGISNELAAPVACVELATGMLLLIVGAGAHLALPS